MEVVVAAEVTVLLLRLAFGVFELLRQGDEHGQHEAVLCSPGFGFDLYQRGQVHDEEFGALVHNRLAMGDQLFKAPSVDQGSKAIERPEARRQEHVSLAEQGRLLRWQTTVRKLTNAGIELVQQSLEPGNVLGTSSMNDVEVLGRDRRSVKHSSSAANHDELHPCIREPPEELPDVSVLWTWHLSRPRAKRRSALKRVVDPGAKATAPNQSVCGQPRAQPVELALRCQALLLDGRTLTEATPVVPRKPTRGANGIARRAYPRSSKSEQQLANSSVSTSEHGEHSDRACKQSVGELQWRIRVVADDADLNREPDDERGAHDEARLPSPRPSSPDTVCGDARSDAEHDQKDKPWQEIVGERRSREQLERQVDART